jgi:hypothetical protein
MRIALARTRLLARASTGVFRTASGFGEIAVGVFENGILVAVAELFFEAKVAVVVVLGFFSGTFGAVGVVSGDLCHGYGLIPGS